MNQTREQVYEYLRHLDFNSIKNLCSSNQYYRNLCNTDIFSTLILKKYSEMINSAEYKLRQLEKQQLNLPIGDTFIYQFNPSDEISIRKLNDAQFYILEHAPSFQKSILYELFKQEFRLSPKEEQVFLATLNSQAPFHNKEELFNVNGSEYSFYVVLRRIEVRLRYATPEQVHKIFELIFKYYRPQVIYRNFDGSRQVYETV